MSCAQRVVGCCNVVVSEVIAIFSIDFNAPQPEP
jgi:hypothetical protein